MNFIEEYSPQIRKIVDTALSEDIGEADVSSLCCIEEKQRCVATIRAKQDGVIAGLELASFFDLEKNSSQIDVLKLDGQPVQRGDVVMQIRSYARYMLGIERTLLNFMQRMSGIATQTNAVVQSIRGYSTRILDTRKTAPGLRIVDKWAVHIGGGTNHRIGLYDAIMLKENHIDCAGGLDEALTKAIDFKKNKKHLPIIVEARDREEYSHIQASVQKNDINRILLDNFSVEDTLLAVSTNSIEVELESSGGIQPSSVSRYAATGVDYISLGMLTHSVSALDLSMEIKML